MRLRLLTFVISSFAAAGVASAAAPLFSGNTDIARRIKEDDAHVVLLGDSLQNLTQAEYLRRWPVGNFVGHFIGQNVGANTGGYTFGFSHPWVSQSLARLPDDPPLADGYTGMAPAATYHVRFSAQPVAPDENVASNRVYTMQLAPNQPANYYGGKWADRDDGQLSVDLLVYANPQGLDSGLRFEVQGNSLTTPLAVTPISTYAATPQTRKYTLTFDAQAWEPGKGLSGAIRMQAGSTPTEGSNLIVLGSRFYTGESGFQMTNIAWGGKKVEYYTNPAHTSDANLAHFLQYTDSNVALMWIGANNGFDDKQTYKNRMLDLIARYKQAKPDLQIALVSNYDLGQPAIGEFPDALYEIAQNDPSLLFLNMHGAAGPFSYLDEHYLSDHIHPNDAGARYFADTLWGLIDSAAATPLPEPSSALALMALGGVAALHRQRRHRRRRVR